MNIEMAGFGQVVIPEWRPSKETRFVPVEHQLVMLGLDSRRALRKLRGKQVVDVGCGNGDLVRYLRENGIVARGIDPYAPENFWFERRAVRGIGPERGIPAEDGSLDRIFISQNTTLNSAYGVRNAIVSSEDRMREVGESRYNQYHQDAIATLSEIDRTLKRGGRAIIFPILEYIQRGFSQILGGVNLDVKTEKILPTQGFRDYMLWEGISGQEADILMQVNYDRRMVLKKK